MSRVNEICGQFFLKRPGDANSKGLVPVLLAGVELSAEARQLVRAEAEAGYWQGYIPVDLMPDAVSRALPYEIRGEIVMERVAWEQVDRRSGKVKSTMINNAYVFIRSLSLVDGSSVKVKPEGKEQDKGGAFDDVPLAGDLGSGGRKGGK